MKVELTVSEIRLIEQKLSPDKNGLGSPERAFLWQKIRAILAAAEVSEGQKYIS